MNGMDLCCLVTATILFIGLVVAVVQLLWSMPRRRHTNIMLDFNRTWESEAFVETRVMANRHSENLEQIMESYNKENKREFFTLIAIPNFFEKLGILVRRRELNFDEVEDHFGEQISHYYRLFQPWIKAQRQIIPELYVDFEFLAEKREQLHKSI